MSPTLRRRLAVLALPALLLAACETDDGDDPDVTDQPEADDQPPEPDEPDAAPEPTGVDLLDAGEEPRAPLRLALEEGTELATTMVLEEEPLAGDGGDAAAPQAQTTSLDLTVTVVETSAEESVLDLAIDEARPEDGVDIPEGEPDPFAAVQGASVLLTVDERNRQRDLRLADEEIDPVAAQVLQQIQPQLIALLAPFPDEDVGVGAVWESVVEQEGIRERTTVELRSRDEDDYGLDLDVVLETPEGEVPVPGSQPDQELTFTELDSSGTGELEGDLTLPFPTSGRLETELVQEIRIGDQADSAQRNEVRITTSIDPG